MDRISLAGGDLPDDIKLLFVTSRQALDKLDHGVDPPDDGAEQTIEAAVTPRHRFVVLERPGDVEGPAWSDPAMMAIREDVGPLDDVDGVVLIGSYDTLPSERKDALALSPDRVEGLDPDDVRDLRAELLETEGVARDTDHFFVWSDDFYGDGDGDGLPDKPVSRIPSDNVFALVRAALGAAGRGVDVGLRGVRDATFGFADDVYTAITALSDPGKPRDPINPAPNGLIAIEDLSADSLYLTMHGGQGKGSPDYHVYLGNRTPVPVVKADELKTGAGEGSAPPFGSVVFAGCCYSGQVTNALAVTSAPAESLPPGMSVARGFVALGVKAVIGFTGTHWLPIASPNQVLGRPLHDAFWRRYLDERLPPSLALFEARKDYIAGAPYATTDDRYSSLFLEGVVLKTYWSATCVGLGW